MFSDSEQLAKFAADAGVDVTLALGHQLPHVYQVVLEAHEAVAATDQIGAFLRSQVVG
ncbi:hypothetical protein [Streptomyces sp. NBC_01518]|uniref:hypothetical protein n=1 Tax=Streptomyces sp. NBC_01518 TaxID=2903891 RepID=UPI003866EA89